MTGGVDGENRGGGENCDSVGGGEGCDWLRW